MECKHGLIPETCAYCTQLLKKCSYNSNSRGIDFINIQVLGSNIDTQINKYYSENYIRKNNHILWYGSPLDK